MHGRIESRKYKELCREEVPHRRSNLEKICTHSFLPSPLHPFTPALPHSFTPSFLHSFVRSSNHPLIHSPMPSIHPFVRSFTQSCMHSVIPCSFIQSCMSSFMHSLIHSLIFHCIHAWSFFIRSLTIRRSFDFMAIRVIRFHLIDDSCHSLMHLTPATHPVICAFPVISSGRYSIQNSALAWPSAIGIPYWVWRCHLLPLIWALVIYAPSRFVSSPRI